MNFPSLQRGADDAVQPRVAGVFRVVQDRLVQAAGDEQVFLHPGFARRGQLRHGDQQRALLAGDGQALQGRFHHGLRPGGVEIDHVHLQLGQHVHSLLDSVGDIVQLQVQEDLVPSGFELPADGRALGVVKLHADLDKGALRAEAVQKFQCLRFAAEIAGDDNVLTHVCAHLQ